MKWMIVMIVEQWGSHSMGDGHGIYQQWPSEMIGMTWPPIWPYYHQQSTVLGSTNGAAAQDHCWV